MQTQEQCAFSGAWRGLPPSGMARVYYVSSYFWDRASDTGIIEHAEAIEWKTSPAEFAKHAEKVSCWMSRPCPFL